ncbi:hypothetical protein [Bosea sp. AS-1]|uniref:hypothetical protein n=1 Tax=Bosea sp. AS-1 TaxID=2015316 RepID=UPI000B76DEE7|nr:hypothetical protein [Bosea sp. AS-1]
MGISPGGLLCGTVRDLRQQCEGANGIPESQNDDSYYLTQSAGRRDATAAVVENQATPNEAGPETGKIIA